MKKIKELNLGFIDAENYQRRENKTFLNNIFVRNRYLDKLLQPATYFLIGDKGTGKTAYSVFLANNDIADTHSEVKFIRETDYEKFFRLKKDLHLGISDFIDIWKVLLLLLISMTINDNEIDTNPFNKTKKLKAIKKIIDNYYNKAFSPEISIAMNLVNESKAAAGFILEQLKLSGEKAISESEASTKFQTNLTLIEREFKSCLSNLKLSINKILLIDGIDIRPSKIPYDEYLECVRGLANAAWSLNNDFFSNIRDTKGKIKIVLLLRPDIFSSLELQNETNKIRDNSVYLNWYTDYSNYRNSNIFNLSDKLLSHQQDESYGIGEVWEYYNPWKKRSTSAKRQYDDAFILMLRNSYSRPRDMVMIMQLLQENALERNENEEKFNITDFESNKSSNALSEYLLGTIKDQLSFYYNKDDYESFMQFFKYLDRKYTFTYEEYINIFTEYEKFLIEKAKSVPHFVDSADQFLQFLYDSNVICYFEEGDEHPLFSWCYRDRTPSNINPRVKFGVSYRVHYGLQKALKLGLKT